MKKNSIFRHYLTLRILMCYFIFLGVCKFVFSYTILYAYDERKIKIVKQRDLFLENYIRKTEML